MLPSWQNTLPGRFFTGCGMCSAAFGGGLGTAGDTNDKEAANMVDINEAKERFAQLLEGQRKRVAAMRAQGDFSIMQSWNRL